MTSDPLYVDPDAVFTTIVNVEDGDALGAVRSAYNTLAYQVLGQNRQPAQVELTVRVKP